MALADYRRSLKKWLCILGGIALYALALDLFLIGNNIAAGGISGVAVVLSNFVPFSVGAMIFVMNIPILLAALYFNGWRYTAGTIAASALYSLAIEALAGLPALTSDPVVAAGFGGAINGAGMALLALGNGSTGGTDLASRMLVKKFPRMSLGKMSLCVDGAVVVFAMIAFQNIESGLYAIVTISVCSFVADRILLGFDRGCLCMVVTSKDPSELSNALMRRMTRAVTRVAGTGMYTGTERSVLYVAVKPHETHIVKEILEAIDPEVFVVVLPANEVLGGTFRTLPPSSRRM